MVLSFSSLNGLLQTLLLLIIYFFVDTYYHKKEPASAIIRDETNIRPIKIQGKRNFIFLAGVVLAVAFLNEQYLTFININPYFKFIREGVIVLMAYLSMLIYSKTFKNIQQLYLASDNRGCIFIFRNIYNNGSLSFIS